MIFIHNKFSLKFIFPVSLCLEIGEKSDLDVAKRIWFAANGPADYFARSDYRRNILEVSCSLINNRALLKNLPAIGRHRNGVPAFNCDRNIIEARSGYVRIAQRDAVNTVTRTCYSGITVCTSR